MGWRAPLFTLAGMALAADATSFTSPSRLQYISTTINPRILDFTPSLWDLRTLSAFFRYRSMSDYLATIQAAAP